MEKFRSTESASEAELAREVLPVENTELALGINLFKQREKWLREMDTDARQCILEMTALCRKSQDLLRGSFLVLIGAENPDGGSRPEADRSEEEFLEHSREFLNEVFVPTSVEEAAGRVPRASGLNGWLRGLKSNLAEAVQNSGPEADFRQKQEHLSALERKAA